MFLSLESPRTQMHIGGMLIFEGPPPAFADIVATVDRKLDRVPRYRQRPLWAPRLLGGRPVWVDDSHFSLDYHLRHTALPAPGTAAQLERTVADIFGRQLDKTRPLWEIWVIEGLRDNRFVVVYKVHHSVVDGISGIDVLQILLDPMPREPAPPREHPWAAPPEPGAAELAVHAAAERLIHQPLGLLNSVRRAIENPREALDDLGHRAAGMGELAWALVDAAPPSPINGDDGPNRRIAWTMASLDDLKAIKNQFGGTINDVVLTAVTGGLRALYRGRGLKTSGVQLRALVPVSVRTSSSSALGNRVAALRAALPVHIDDPVERLRWVSSMTGDLKKSAQAIGAQTLTSLTEVAPPALFHQASRLQFSTRLFNLIVTNVPGPQVPLYLLGSRMLEGVPLAFLPAGHGLAVAIVSYNGTVGFGLLADRELVPDADVVAEGITRDVDEMALAASPARTAARAGDAAPSTNGVGAPAGASTTES
jgi:WS/DGAT/MGAT family acyltransferase